MRTDRFALADLGQQDRLDEIVTDAARGLEDTFDVNERSNTSTGKSTDGDLHDLGLRWASENRGLLTKRTDLYAKPLT